MIGVEVDVSIRSSVMLIYFIVHVHLQILENVLVIHLVDPGKVLSMMDFWVVVLFQDPLGVCLDCLLQSFELMTTTT